MKHTVFFRGMARFTVPTAFFLSLVGFIHLPAHGQQSMLAPSVFVDEPRHSFQPVVDGTVITHHYTLENRGDAPLLIERVVSGCGCTAVDYDRRIPPGAWGTVTIRVDTSGYGGERLSYGVEVHTNAPDEPVVSLWVEGDVLEFAKLSKRVVKLKGKAGENLTETVTIEPGTPFAIREVTATPGRHVAVTWTGEGEGEKARFRLTVKNTAQSPGRYLEKVVVRTDSPVRPEIAIPVQGVIE